MPSPARKSPLSHTRLSLNHLFLRHIRLLTALLALFVTLGALALGQPWSVTSARRMAERARIGKGAAHANFGAMFAPPIGGSITVNSTADTVANDGQCTLREAITAANTDTASGAAAGECA